jgi:hypothetical protein
MILFVWLLFWRDKENSTRQIVALKNPFQVVVLLLFGVLPGLSLVGLWDSYLSLALFSGNTQQAVIYVEGPVIEQLPAPIHPHIWQGTQPFFLDINRWAYDELKVPVYPEPRIYRAVARRICKYADNSKEIMLRIKLKPDAVTGHRESQLYHCDHVY